MYGGDPSEGGVRVVKGALSFPLGMRLRHAIRPTGPVFLTKLECPALRYWSTDSNTFAGSTFALRFGGLRLWACLHALKTRPVVCRLGLTLWVHNLVFLLGSNNIALIRPHESPYRCCCWIGQSCPCRNLGGGWSDPAVVVDEKNPRTS